MVKRPRIGIIGAGMAGLTVARALSSIADIGVFEKSRGVGGRMATRRIDEVSFDHGAQYFTIRSDRFHDSLKAGQADGVIQSWNGEVVSLSRDGLSQRFQPATPRYAGVPSMNALPKAMAIGLDVRVDEQVAKITGDPGRWFLHIADRREGPFDWVFATAPAPQSSAVLPSRFAHHDMLGAVEMSACFTLMIRLDYDGSIPFVAARIDDPVIDWISRNNTKPGRSEAPCLVVNSNSMWADANTDKPLDTIRQKMIEAVRRYIPVAPSEADAAMIHRWRYANVQRPAGSAYLMDRASQLAACGDWCIGGRVEAAFLSGAGLADALREIIEASE
ncbi:MULTISPECIES: FAD-dependent oxidoreductase [unclassified Rhizobium]|uniref:NAD(P)/FAD-dependent oxidoreductase n=1 Tax=unclassified Rhizobium TaxID=2613769 RepID=UPI0009E847B6|nr:MULTISPECIES: FAD-dependent oxidoreductase [unclassified Rhizobium]